MPAKQWVDFRHVRETVEFGEVLQAYGVTLKLRGDHQHHGFCPLPKHNGQGRSPSFSAHLEKKAFHCFGCQAQGNAIDFVALMEGLNPDDPRDVRKAALLIQERFLKEEAKPPPRTTVQSPDNSPQKTPTRDATKTEQGRSPPNGGNRLQPQRQRERPPRPAKRKSELNPEKPPADPPQAQQPDNRPRVINAPLDFELKGLDLDHPYLQTRGLTPETIRTFGLGYCGRGLMAGRIAIPLHDHEGNLIGYAGRIVDDSQIGEENPKYRLPGARERDGEIFEFRKSAFLFNGHRVQAPATDLIVVEGFFSVFHLHQCGWANTVALMGSSCSHEQAELIVRLTAPNGGEAGRV